MEETWIGCPRIFGALGDGQAQSQAAVAAGFGMLEPLELLEDHFQMVLGNPRSGIPGLDQQ